eukprot:Hpha_TRINITY_DN26102_c0_g1::TRINITY_DN26102_c0_g1_i1::g.155468::m.155468
MLRNVAVIARRGEALRGQVRALHKKDAGSVAFRGQRGRPVDVEYRQALSSIEDEKTQELFGVDHLPWVHTVKDPLTSGRLDPEHHLLQELPVYSQIPDVRNDWGHHARQGVPRKIAEPHELMFHWGQSQNYYLGAYPNKDAAAPGEYWKSVLSKQLPTGMHWERSKARAGQLQGGPFGLPGDDYNTLEGVPPLISALGWRALKYDTHEPLVRALNEALPALHRNAATDVQTITNLGKQGVSELAAEHEGLCIFYKSVRPRGNVIRDGLAQELSAAFGSLEELRAGFVAKAGEADGFVYLVYNTDTLTFSLLATDKGTSPREQSLFNVPLLACPLQPAAWNTDWDSKEEFAARFLDVADWEFVTSVIAHARNEPQPEPLVF